MSALSEKRILGVTYTHKPKISWGDELLHVPRIDAQFYCFSIGMTDIDMSRYEIRMCGAVQAQNYQIYRTC